MTRSELLVVLLLCFCLYFSRASADTVSCVLFDNHLSPNYTYSLFYADDNGSCCQFCAQDAKCVAWSRDRYTGKCALKSDCDILVEITGVDSGVKHLSERKPVLEFNGVGAYVLVARSNTESPPPPVVVAANPVPRQFVISASSSASSSSGESSSSFSSVSITGDKISTRSGATGNAVAMTFATTPTLSLATKTVGKDGETSRLAVLYYNDVKYVGTVPLIGGKEIQIISNSSAELPCLNCTNYKCLSTPQIVYEGGYILEDVVTEDYESCCLLCRTIKYCVSWWRNSRTKRCVLNSDLPALEANKTFTGGIVL